MKMFLEILLLVIVVVVLFFLLFYFAKPLLFPKMPTPRPNLSSSVCINGNCFDVELAETYFERTKGLMFRKKLADDSGMLFIFNKEGIYPFWMKNTLIPLDIIWIKENPSTGSGQVVFINENNQPCKTFFCPSIKPAQPAKYVLEINAGISQKLGFQIGDEVSFK